MRDSKNKRRNDSHKISKRVGRTAVLGTFLALLLGIGCSDSGNAKRDYVEVYQPPAAEAHGPHDGHNHGPAQTPAKALGWACPEGWTEQGGGGMRLAAFAMKVGEEEGLCTIISLGGGAGGVESNIARWLGQLKIELSPDQLQNFLHNLDAFTSSHGVEGAIADFSLLQKNQPGETPSMLASIIQNGSQTVFVKLTGSLALVTGEKERFKALHQSLTFKE